MNLRWKLKTLKWDIKEKGLFKALYKRYVDFKWKIFEYYPREIKLFLISSYLVIFEEFSYERLAEIEMGQKVIFSNELFIVFEDKQFITLLAYIDDLDIDYFGPEGEFLKWERDNFYKKLERKNNG
jgi:hypothetical protein